MPVWFYRRQWYGCIHLGKARDISPRDPQAAKLSPQTGEVIYCKLLPVADENLSLDELNVKYPYKDGVLE